MLRRDSTAKQKEKESHGQQQDWNNEETNQMIELELLENKQSAQMYEDYFQSSECGATKTSKGPKELEDLVDIVLEDDSPSIELVTPSSTEEPLGLLPQSTHRTTTTTSNTDVCVLDESLYAAQSSYDIDDDEEGDGDSQCEQLRMERSIDAPDFTVLHAPPSSPPTTNRRRQSFHVCDESTEVLLLHDSEYNGRATCSGTDSDVEVLMSEEIIDSDWSADCGLIRLEQDVPQMSPMRAAKPSAVSFNCVRQQESTDQDISVEEFSHSTSGCADDVSVSAFEHLNRSQLLDMIHGQSERIRSLEERVQNYRAAQQTLFEHVDALRLQFGTNTINDTHN